jgi:phosphoadenosine phosphosulfate reductase
MDELERQQHRLHARLPAFKRKLERASAIINEAIQMVAPDRWMLSFSGGADSLVMLDLLDEMGFLSSIGTRWVDDGWDYPATITFLAETEQRYGFRLQRMRSVHNWREWCIEMGRPELGDDPAAYEAWGNPRDGWSGGWNTHSEWLASLAGYDGVFLGLLASESRARSYALHNGYKPLYQVKSEGGMWHCSPLAAWTKRDVFAYLISRDVPYNPVYDKLAALGVPLDRRRVAPLTCYRVLHYGSASQFRQIDNSLYNRLATTFPRIREFS